MTLTLNGDLTNLLQGLEEVKKYLQVEIPEAIEVVQLPEDAPLALEIVRGEENRISYKKRHHFFRALGLYAQFVKEGQKAFFFNEEVEIERCGGMFDCSRNSVYTVAKVKDLLVQSALIGMSTCMLYTEDTYEIPENPYFGYLRGKYTQAEIREIDDYAYNLGIELIPCIQTLAHLKTTLKWPYAWEMRDTPDILYVGHEKTYEFIASMFKSIKETFRTNRVHIGMDEAFDMGRGRYLNDHEHTPTHKLMVEHLNRVFELIRTYELEPMMWDDMFFNHRPESENTEDLVNKLRELVGSKVPKEVSLVYWDYYQFKEGNYDYGLALREAFDNPVIFAGGIWTWTGYVINYDKTWETVNPAMAACKKRGVQEIIATMWGDDGAETAIDTVIPGMILYGEHAYSTGIDEAWIDRRCQFLTGLTLDEFRSIQKLDYIPGVESPNGGSANPHKYLLYQDTLLGAFDFYKFDDSLPSYYAALAKELAALVDKTAYYAPMYRMYSGLAEVLSYKADLGRRMITAYKADDRVALKELADVVIPQTQDALARFKDALREQWYNDCKGHGFEILDARLGGVANRLDTAAYRINLYLAGKIDVIEELAEERLALQPDHTPEVIPHANHYASTASQNVASHG